MRNNRSAGITGHPVGFLVECIEKSGAYHPSVKAHVLQIMRPYTRTYRVTFEQAQADAALLNAYAQWANACFALHMLDLRNPSHRRKRSIYATEVRAWGVAMAKSPAARGMAQPKGRSNPTINRTGNRKREIPPPTPTADTDVEPSGPIAETA